MYKPFYLKYKVLKIILKKMLTKFFIGVNMIKLSKQDIII